MIKLKYNYFIRIIIYNKYIKKIKIIYLHYIYMNYINLSNILYYCRKKLKIEIKKLVILRNKLPISNWNPNLTKNILKN